MRRNSLVLVTLILVASGAAAQSPSRDEVSPRISRLEAWLSAIAAHRPGAFDDSVRLINTWNQEQLRLISIDVGTIVSVIREPGVGLFFITEPPSRRSTQVLYSVAELRRIRELAKRISPQGAPGPENDILKRGAMLHADIDILVPLENRARADAFRPGPGGGTLFMDDGKQLAFKETVSHWKMGRGLLDRVRPVDSKKGLRTTPDPGADDTVRRWYLAGCAYMARLRRMDTAHFVRALELFPNDPDVLFLAAAAHESFAGVRTQSVMRSLNAPRGVTFDVQGEGAELRLAEQLYKRALERNPNLVEARIRLGRVLGLRGRHEEAVEQLRQGESATEPLLQFYAHLFQGAEFDALGNVAEARRSYERAAALNPTAQSPLFGLSRVADQTGDRAAAKEVIGRLLKLPDDSDRADPWSIYEYAYARVVDQLLAELRQRF